ncbi:nuclear transport factor 2 family protein [Palleronia abyssalis]|uniref:SnoaL-like domain-containing protein n=1 Tax=Palleronia abyssalis TaxID=1501240 RepID=A0A2R8C0U2_9RHOB|nr:nuclear transport factor 2 family protein [Palleronia abyssalis]SPJ26047.1 hypothetical protein PAA8504_03903 [Palleronia abyssalis]
MNIHLVSAVVALSVVSTQIAAQTFPPQHWAGESGLLSLGENGQVDLSAADPMDILRIEEAFIRWGLYYDEGRSDLLPSLFTESGEMVATLGSAEPIATFTGPEEIGGYVDATLEQQGDQRRHSITNFLVQEISESEASAMAYGIVMVAADGLSVGSSVVYTGDLTKGDDGVWKFERLTIAIDDYAGNLN